MLYLILAVQMVPLEVLVERIEHHARVDVHVALRVPLGVLRCAREVTQRGQIGAERVHERVDIGACTLANRVDDGRRRHDVTSRPFGRTGSESQ